MSRRLIAAGLGLLLAAGLIGLLVGRYDLPLSRVPAALAGDDEAVVGRTVLLRLRLPRVLFAGLVGAALSVAGAVFQGIFRNPLVSPNILGVSAGAAFGAAVGIVALGGGAVAVQGGAFAAGLLAVMAAVAVGRRVGASETTLVLAGIAVSALFGALLMLLKTMADPERELPAIVFWLMGGLHRVTWRRLAWTAPVLVGGLAGLHALRWKLNVLAMGHEEAHSLGLPAGPFRGLLIALATLMVAASVAVAGAIGWVGLVLPHVARMLLGADHRRLVPGAAVIGAAFLILTDTLARSLTTAEIPIGILTSLIGAPFFLYLLVHRRSGFER